MSRIHLKHLSRGATEHAEAEVGLKARRAHPLSAVPEHHEPFELTYSSVFPGGDELETLGNAYYIPL